MGFRVSKEEIKFRTYEDFDQVSSHLTPQQIKLVRQSWTHVSQDLANIGMLIFKRLISHNPEIAKLFKKLMIFKEDGSYDWDMSQLERHAVLVMQALEAAIENLDDSKVLSVILKELGCKHARYNVQEFMFQKLWKAIKYSLTTSLGPEVMNKETVEAWFHVFQFIALHIIQGMREYKNAIASNCNN